MTRIPLATAPNQTLAVTLDQQNVQLALRQNASQMYIDVQLNDQYVVRSRVCRDRQRLLTGVRYKGLKGDFAFIDTQGTNDPEWTGLGAEETARYLLLFLSDGE